MVELKYTICKSEVEKLIYIKLHKDKWLKKSLKKRIVFSEIILFIIIIIISKEKNANLVELIAALIILFIPFRLAIAIILWLNDRLVVREYSMRVKQSLNKEMYIRAENNMLTIRLGDSKHICNIKDSMILDSDDKNIYIKFVSGSAIYIPKDAFENESAMNEFLELLNGNEI